MQLHCGYINYFLPLRNATHTAPQVHFVPMSQQCSRRCRDRCLNIATQRNITQILWNEHPVWTKLTLYLLPDVAFATKCVTLDEKSFLILPPIWCTKSANLFSSSFWLVVKPVKQMINSAMWLQYSGRLLKGRGCTKGSRKIKHDSLTEQVLL